MADKFLNLTGLTYFWGKIKDLLADYAPKNNAALTGNPTAPTQSAGNNSTRIATTAFVQTAVSNATPGKQILSQEVVTLSTSSSTAIGGTATVTGTFTAVSGAAEYIIFPRTCNYGFFTALSRSGTTVSATIRNLSNGAHTLTGSVGVIALK